LNKIFSESYRQVTKIYQHEFYPKVSNTL